MTAKKDPFAALEALRDKLPPGSAPVVAKPPEKLGPARAVVRLEKKGRRGKEVTVVEKLELKPAELETWCRELKQALGSGGAIEEGAIVIQGDHRTRLGELLEKRGVRKVTISG